MEEKIIKLLLKEANKSYKLDEVPIGCVIVKDGKIICSAHNTRENKSSVIGHAEINTILKAGKKLKSWNLNTCKLYVTLKPCEMCEKIIQFARINEVYYILDSKYNNENKNQVSYSKIFGEYENKIKSLLSSFFKNKR